MWLTAHNKWSWLWKHCFMAYFCVCPMRVNGSQLTADSLSVMSYVYQRAQRATNRPSRRCNIQGWTRTADPSMVTWCVMKTAIHTLSIGVSDCIRHRNALKLFIHLHISSKSVTFATWYPAKWHENQIEIRSKTPLIPQTLRTRAELVAF